MMIRAVNIQKAAQQAFNILRIGCFHCRSSPVGVRVSGYHIQLLCTFIRTVFHIVFVGTFDLFDVFQRHV